MDPLDLSKRLAQHAADSAEYHVFVLISAVYGTMAITLALSHMRSYFHHTQLSKTQRKLRICLIVIVGAVPMTSLLSVLKVLFYRAFLAFEFVRASYEAVALYMFFELIVYLLGGNQKAIQHFDEHEPRHIYSAFPCCCLTYLIEPTRLTPSALYWIRRGALQICFTRPIIAFASITLHVNIVLIFFF